MIIYIYYQYIIIYNILLYTIYYYIQYIYIYYIYTYIYIYNPIPVILTIRVLGAPNLNRHWDAPGIVRQGGKNHFSGNQRLITTKPAAFPQSHIGVRSSSHYFLKKYFGPPTTKFTKHKSQTAPSSKAQAHVPITQSLP